MRAVHVTWLLMVAAAWNILGGVSALLDPPGHFEQLYTRTMSLADPLALFFYRCTWINVMAWGVAYAIAARVSASRTAVLAAGAIGKATYFAAFFALYATGQGKLTLLGAGLFDLLLALLFVLALVWQHRVESPLATNI